MPTTTQRLARALDTIATVWDATEDPPRQVWSTARRHLTARLPVPVDVLSTRRETADILRHLTHTVRHGRDLRCQHPTTDTRAIARWLKPHAEWIAAHALGPEATARTLSRLASTLRTIATCTRPSAVVLGPCPLDDDDHAPCAGVITATVAPDTEDRPTRVECTADPTDHYWTPYAWDHMRRLIEHTRDTRDWLPVTDAATVTGIPERTIRQWATTGAVDIVRIPGQRRPVTHVSVAQLTTRRTGTT